MKYISALTKPIFSLCNIRCKYGFYANISSIREVRSYEKMTEDVEGKMIAQIFVDLEDGDHLTMASQGGEPILAGLTCYRDIVALIAA